MSGSETPRAGRAPYGLGRKRQAPSRRFRARMPRIECSQTISRPAGSTRFRSASTTRRARPAFGFTTADTLGRPRAS